MFIKQITIYGFGQFVDRQFTLNERLTCFYGVNESGKSTLQRFILFMLFGLPPRKRKFYQPKNSGKLGGRLTIIDQEIGQYTIERIEGDKNAQATCYLASGEVRDEKWLNKQLQGFTSEIFTSVYLFSSIDLLDFEQMDGEDIGNILLSVGLTGAKDMYVLEKTLDKQLGDLFKPYGKNPTLNQQLTHLANLQKQLAEHERHFTNYREKRSEIEKLSTSMINFSKQRQQLQERIHHISKLLQSLPLIYDYEYHTEQLNQLPSSIRFPEQGIERYEDLKKRLTPLKSELNLLVKQISNVETTIKQFQQQLLPDDIIQHGKRISQRESIYEERSNKREKIATDIEQKLKTIENSLNQLNLPLALSDLIELSFPFQTAHYWQTLSDEQKQIDHEKEHCLEQIRQLEIREDKLNKQIKTIEETLLNAEERQQYITALDTNQISQMNEQLKQEKRKKNVTFIFSVISSIIFLLSGYLKESTLLIVTGFLLLIIGSLYTYLLHESIRKIDQLMINSETNALPLPLKSYEERLAQLEKDDSLNYKLGSLQDELKREQATQLQWIEKQRAIHQRDERLQQQLTEIRQTYPFLDNIQFQYWSDLYYKLNHLKEDYENVLAMKKDYQQLIDDQNNLKQTLIDFTQKVHLYVESLSIGELFEKLNEWIEQQVYMKQQIIKEQSKLDSYLRKQNNLQEHMKGINDEINELFKRATVDSEEKFYEQASKLREKQNHGQSMKKLNQQLGLIFQNSMWRSLIDGPLEETLLIDEKKEHQRKIQTLDERMENKRQRLANLKAKISQIEQSNEYSNIKHQSHVAQHEFNELAKQWAVLKVAQGMLQQTKQTYQEKYLTSVLEQTSKFFQHITKSAYVKVILRQETESLVVQRNDQTFFELGELSKGTIDQLYIAFRLAVGKVIGSDYQLPFIIDDAFIHSDDERAKNIVDILQRIANKQQIIIFTCQQHIANHFSGNQLKPLHQKVRL